MKINKKALIAGSILLIVAAVSIFWFKIMPGDYITATVDTSNTCKYNANGEMTRSTIKKSKLVTEQVPADEFEQYRKDAIASGKCIRSTTNLPANLYKEFRCDRMTKEGLPTDKYCNDYELYKRDHAAGKI